MQRIYRSWSRLTPMDVQRISDQTPPEKYMQGGLGGGEYMPAYTDALNGKTVSMTFEGGEQYTYEFVEARKLRWSAGSGERKDAPCNIHLVPGETDIYFVQHYVPGSRPPEAHTLVIDFGTGRATLVVAKIGTQNSPADVGRRFLFGTIDGAEVTGEPHGFTDELIGTAIVWEYFKGGPKVKHMYCAPGYYTYAGMFGGWWMATNPADYTKVNDHLYIFSMIEERQTGVQGLFLINTDILHDVGSFFGCHAVGMECYTVGAKGVRSEMTTTPEEMESLNVKLNIGKFLPSTK